MFPKLRAKAHQRFKTQLTVMGLGTLLLLVGQQFVQSQESEIKYDGYRYDGHDYKGMESFEFAQGTMHAYYDTEEICNSWVLIPGVVLMPNGLLAVFYFFCLMYLFLGISIVSDVFMGSIEVITSSTKTVTKEDPVTHEKEDVTVKVWNPTLANLTLMALGSSAPEILLSVIETVQTLESIPGELGPSTIVGSAAFNLMVISAVSVVAVSEDNAPNIIESTGEPDPNQPPAGLKKINDLGVFGITAVSSVFAYLWLYLCLSVISPNYITLWEALVTFGFFFLLVAMAFCADKRNERKMARREHNVPNYTYGEILKTLQKEKMDVERMNAKEKMTYKEKINKIEKFMMQEYNKVLSFQEVVENEKDFKHRLDLDPLLPRIAARKKVSAVMTGKKEILKKQKFLKSNVFAKNLEEKDKNTIVGFEVLHYSVAESQGKIEITIIKKQKSKQSFTVGIRTVDGEAIADEDYKAIDELITFEKNKTTAKVSIDIIDDDDWEPDENFYVELYDTKSGQRLPGEDTRTTITIIDDDKPGNLSFAKRIVPALISEKSVQIEVLRKDGCDGVITCQYALEEADEAPSGQRAIRGQDFENQNGSLTFVANQTRATINVNLFPTTEPRDGIFFYVRLSRPNPSVVKVNSKDNGRCRVELIADETQLKKQKAEHQLIEAIDRREEPTLGDQLKEACMLYPTKNEDGIIEDVSTFDAVFHFLAIGWKVIFALIPPPHIWGGWLAFGIALCFIGMVTAIVGEVAALFGCVIGLKPAVTAITFVALGTSLPDTFASKQAAQDDKYADSAVGNVTGSNSVNVFLGLGLPWVIAAVYNKVKYDRDYNVPAGALAFSVMLFLITSITCLLVIVLRRCIYKGELGGPKGPKYASAFFMCLLWFIYVIFSSLKAYDKM